MVIILSRFKNLIVKLSSLRWKLFLTYLLISLIPLVFFAYTISNTMEDYFSNNKEILLKRQANQIATEISSKNYLTDESLRPYFTLWISTQQNLGERIVVVDSKAAVVADTNGTDLLGAFLVYPEIAEALASGNAARLQNDRQAMHAAVSITDSQSHVIGAVLLVSPINEINDLLGFVSQQLVLLTVLLGLVTAVLVFFISQLIIDPVKNILKVVQKMSEGHLNQRISVTGYDEFAELSAAFNDMTEQLERVETTRQEFVSNVSHELKTPLSSMKVLGESLVLQEDVPGEVYREFLQDIISEVDRMTNIINELLALVKLDRTDNALNIKQTRVNKMAEDILKRLYPLAEQKNIELLYEDVRSVVIDADEMKLSLAISNLVENAIKYTPEGGTVKVIVDADHQNAFITVQDNGIGISEEDQNKVFVRFYRVDKTRDRETGGTGLGLAITHKTVLLHNGSIKLLSKLGEGSTFVVRLPIHQN